MLVEQQDGNTHPIPKGSMGLVSHHSSKELDWRRDAPSSHEHELKHRETQ